MSILSSQLANPFRDQDFAYFQLKSGKAQKIHKIDNLNVYQFKLFGKYCMFYATKWNDKITQIAKQESAIYTLVESYENQEPNTKAKKPFKSIIPRYTIAIDLQKSEQEILSAMHPKGRYNIRLAEKKGLEIKTETNIDNFYALLSQTKTRDKFNINPKNTYETMLKILGTKNKAELITAYFDNDPVASIFVTYIGNTATYYYGASSNEHRNLMAPYLLQWHAICEAKKRGFQYYDFLGVADPLNKKDPLRGVTEFKQKFGGEFITHPKGYIVAHKILPFLLLRSKHRLGV